MKKNLKIGFMGTPDFAVTSLEALIDAGFEVVVVITAPDRPAGRGRKLTASAVKTAALKHQIPVLQPERLKDPGFLDELEGFGINLLVVVAFRMLPRVVWELPELGTFNLHASLLPDYRGAAPINWAIINGETKTGVTTFFIDEKIDTGNIILQQSTHIGPEETAGELHDRLMFLGADLVVETARRIEAGGLTTSKQGQSTELKTAPKLERENCRISWSSGATDIHNLIRGLSPYPGAWTLFENGNSSEQVKIFRSAPVDRPDQGAPGTLLSEGKSLFAATGHGWLELLQIQLPGKKRMPVQEVLNGLELKNNARFL